MPAHPVDLDRHRVLEDRDFLLLSDPGIEALRAGRQLRVVALDMRAPVAGVDPLRDHQIGALRDLDAVEVVVELVEVAVDQVEGLLVALELASVVVLEGPAQEGVAIDLDVAGLIKAHKNKRSSKVFTLRRVLSVAASVMLVVSIYFMRDQYTASESQVEQIVYNEMETYEDPELALEQTKAALAFLATKMNKGQEATVKNVKRIEVLDDVIPE